MLPIHRVLCPTDFSERSLQAFHVACALARDYDAKLTVIHVQPASRGGAEVTELITDKEEVKQAILQKLNTLQPQDATVPVERLLKTGDAAKEIVHTAKELGTDVIVMGTHGHTALGRLLLGSVAESVLRKARCPVFMVKAPFPESAADSEKGPGTGVK